MIIEGKNILLFQLVLRNSQEKMHNLCRFNEILGGLQSTLNPNIERTTHAIEMIVSAFNRYDLTLSNANKIKMQKHLEVSKF